MRPRLTRIFPPEPKARPEGYWRNGLSKAEVKSCWGKVSVKVQRLKANTGERKQVYYDACLDESGWSSEALERLLELSSRLPYEEASYLAGRFGLAISGSTLERLTSPYALHCEQAICERLSQARAHPVQHNAQAQGRVMVLQVDGVYVLGRPEAGTCPGLEIKSAVLYPQSSPGERWMLATRCSAEDFLPLLDGLLREAGITAQDTLVGLGDGAKWIDNIFHHLNARRVTDVFHAAEYLDAVMQALAWNQDIRFQHRCSWYRAETSAKAWLEQHLPEPDVWMNWSADALTALRYLEQRLDSMDYPSFKADGYPIGSGQVEAMNKAVIGHRLKRSGMHWSAQGATAMASLRAQLCAKHPLIDFDALRFKAFALAA